MKNSFNTIHQALRRIYDKHRRMYRENRSDSKQLCCMWSTDDPPDIIEGTEPISDLEDTFEVTIDDDEALELYNMTVDEAARRILEIKERERLKNVSKADSNPRMNKTSNTIGNFIDARKSLEQDRAQAIERLKEIDRVLGGSVPVRKPAGSKRTRVEREKAKPHGRRVMSDEAKQKIATAQRKAWAARKAKDGKIGEESGGRVPMSEEAKKKRSDAMRKAWAKRKALKK